MRFIINRLVKRILPFYPHLKKSIRIAHIETTPAEFIYNNFKSSLFFSLGITVFSFFILDKAELPLILLPLILITIFFLMFNFKFLRLKTKIYQRQKEIDREVLFVGQHLLVKLYSGKPLLNALIETTGSRGVASKYIKEIVDDINTGNTIENSLHHAMIYSPSEKFRKILFHINNALKLGIDVTGPLSTVLDEIAREHRVEILRYGKKLNTIVMFYMLGAVVLPSIGMTIFIVLSSFINFTIGIQHFLLVLFFIILIEFIFLSIFKSIRPVVSL